jgi:glutamate/tyrosine decarboxylase-like PLP-dependent enzyme
MVIPDRGRSAEDLLAEIGELRRGDLDWRRGRAFSLVYHADDPELEGLLHRIGALFLHENALNPFRYKTLLKMEAEIVEMAVGLFGAGCGALSSGGTESIFLAVQTARDLARARGIARPQLVCTDTAHPAFAKACRYLDVEMVRLPHGTDGRAVPERYAGAIGERTALLVASSPCYPFGVIDPVAEIAALAARHDLLCHVDACLGGWLLPWWEKLGRTVPAWDFRVPGVTSLSADIHKYGYAFKGASVILYRDRDLLERQFFLYDAWPGGLYASASTAGTRPGAPIAGAWAAISHLGQEGYLRLTARVMEATDHLLAGIRQIDPLRIHYKPDLSLFEFGSARIDMNALCDVMDERGWNLDRQQGGLHLMVSPGHDRVAEAFLDDLRAAVASHGSARGGAALYGGIVP